MKKNSIAIDSQNIRRITRDKMPRTSSMKSFTNKELEEEWQQIQAAQQKSSAFRPLYDRYYEPIFRFILKRMANQETAADITAQVFLKALKKLHQYKYQSVPFSAWLFRIASNEIAQYYRKSGKSRIVSLEDHHVHQLIEETHSDDFEDRKKIMLTVLSSLKPKDLEIIELRFFEGYSFKEIAQIMEITESNAKVKTHRIVERMRKKVEQLYK